jgi:hypothetical protein
LTERDQGGDPWGSRFEELSQPTHQSLRDLHAYWLSKKGTRKAPARSAIDPDEMVKLLPSIAMLDVVGDPPRFRFRLFGTRLATAYGQDLTGKFVDEIDVGGRIPPELLARAAKVVRQCCIDVGRSQYTKKSDQRRVEYERILLPLSEDGETVNMILCAYAIETAFG